MNYEYCDGITHTIKQGETLYSLSRYYKIPLAILLRANPYIDVYNLKAGDTICVPVKNTGKNRTMNSNTGITGMNTSMGANMGTAMPDSTNMGMEKPMSENANMPDNTTGMNMNMDITPVIPDDSKKDVSRNEDEKEKEKEKKDEDHWIKYVAQAGDTLQDILDRSEGSEDMFWDKNSADRMYMLPGVAYFILENDAD